MSDQAGSMGDLPNHFYVISLSNLFSGLLGLLLVEFLLLNLCLYKRLSEMR